MDGKLRKSFFLLVLLFFSQHVFAVPSNWHIFVSFSGGYGEVDDAYQNTGTSGIIRLAFGSLIPVHPSLVLGGQVGFQTSTQFRLNQSINFGMGSTSVPVFEAIKTPIDFLAIGRYQIYKPLFFQAKAGLVFLSSTATGADLQTGVNWFPEVQAGLGINVYKRSRFTLGYQQFFGTKPTISIISLTDGTYQIKGNSTWRAVLLTFEHDF